MRKLLEKAALTPEFLRLVQVSIGALAFGLFLLIPPPSFVSRLLYQPNWLILILLFVFFALVLHQNGRSWELLQIVLIFGLFAIPLIYKWQFAYYDGSIIGGLLPWSDASDYFEEASHLANGLLFTPWGGRRPLFASSLAVILRLNSGNFMGTLAILTLMNSSAVVIALQAIKRWYGATAAAAYLLIAYEFYAVFAGKTLTEQLGFALGNLSLFILLVGVETRSFWRALLGLGTLALALNARAGAFFVLPVLVLWLAFYFRPQITFWRLTGLGIVVLMIAFLSNILLARVLTGKQQTAFSNYSYTLYGLASGNKGWAQVFQDYPNVTEAEVMPLAIQKIRENPGLLLYGMMASYRDYFRLPSGAFSFMLDPAESKANLLLWACVLMGLVYSYRKKETGTGGLVLISFLGVLVSLSLLPPIDADAMRAFAATIPFTALWVAAGVSALRAWVEKRFAQEKSEPIEETELPFKKLALAFSIALIALAIPTPLLLRIFPNKALTSTPPSQAACLPTQKLLKGVVFEDTSIILIPDDAAQESYMPFIRTSDFRRPIKSSYPFLDEELIKLPSNSQITYGLLLENESPAGEVYMVSNFPVHEGRFTVCSDITDNEQLQPYHFYYLKGEERPLPALTFSQRHASLTLLTRLFYGLGLGLIFFVLIANTFGFKRKSLDT